MVHGDPVRGAALSLRWTATDRPCEQFGVLRRMLVAGDVATLLDGQEGWVDPLNNLVAADVGGHIGYLLRGELPARASLAPAQVPVPGWESGYRWRGRVPFTAMPRLEDPPEGVIVTANNTVTSAEYPFVSHSMNDCYRVERIHELSAAGVHGRVTVPRTWSPGRVTRCRSRPAAGPGCSRPAARTPAPPSGPGRCSPRVAVT